MRDIKFRAWHKQEKYMFKPEALWFNKFNTNDVWLNNSHNYGEEKYRNKLYGYAGKEIELMQYTGLKDKKGIEIYEGDIYKTKLDTIFLIKCGVFDNLDDDRRYDGNGFYMQSIKIEEWLIPCCERDIRDGEVIGNIYENPPCERCQAPSKIDSIYCESCEKEKNPGVY